MTSGLPRVSIGLPVYNGEAYLSELLDSLLAQDYGNLELLISDNASTDATGEICRRYAARDPRIHYERAERNLGAAANYNRVFELAKGEYFKWAAHDDRYAPRYLGRCVATLDGAPSSVVLCYPKTIIIDGTGQVVREHADNLDIRSPLPRQRLRHFVQYWSLCNPIFGLIRADALRKTSLIRGYPGSDVTLLAELSLLGEFWEIPEPLFYRRIHADSSRQGGNLTLRGVTKWFDPAARARGWPSPRTRLFFHVLGTIRRAELGAFEKLRCAALCSWTWGVRRLRVRGGRMKRSLATMRSRPRSKA